MKHWLTFAAFTAILLAPSAWPDIVQLAYLSTFAAWLLLALALLGVPCVLIVALVEPNKLLKQYPSLDVLLAAVARWVLLAFVLAGTGSPAIAAVYLVCMMITGVVVRALAGIPCSRVVRVPPELGMGYAQWRMVTRRDYLGALVLAGLGWACFIVACALGFQ